MKMKDPIPQFSHLVSTLASSHPNLAYLHVVEPPPIEERSDVKDLAEIPEESNDFLRKIWSPRPFISCGGYVRQTALATAKSKSDLIAFGRPYISNVSMPRSHPLKSLNSTYC
jgi:NADPH2 dehydrogenase